jgi:hypothetical protein
MKAETISCIGDSEAPCDSKSALIALEDKAPALSYSRKLAAAVKLALAVNRIFDLLRSDYFLQAGQSAEFRLCEPGFL